MKTAIMLLASASLAFAPAPFPKPQRNEVPWPVGVWEGHNHHDNSTITLVFRTDGSYLEGGNDGRYDGTWSYDAGDKQKARAAVKRDGERDMYLTVVVKDRNTLKVSDWVNDGPFRRLR